MYDIQYASRDGKLIPVGDLPTEKLEALLRTPIQLVDPGPFEDVALVVLRIQLELEFRRCPTS